MSLLFLDRFSTGNHGLYLAHVEDGRVKHWYQASGQVKFYEKIVPTQNKRLIVDTVVEILKRLVRRRFSADHFERHIFTQLMRYSILSTVVDDVGERNRFFDNVSKIDHGRTQVLFWLQWHMAMVDQERFLDAETYFEAWLHRSQGL